MVDNTQKRIRNCQNMHEDRATTKMPLLPKRVIDVGINKSDNPVHFHLSEANEHAPYAALSYCWGGSQDIVTTSSSLQSYTISLPEALPRTIQDTITVTRRLNIRYL